MNDIKMTPGELRATGFRDCFLATDAGMFMVLPVLTTYGMALQGASEALISWRLVFMVWLRRYSRSV